MANVISTRTIDYDRKEATWDSEPTRAEMKSTGMTAHIWSVGHTVAPHTGWAGLSTEYPEDASTGIGCSPVMAVILLAFATIIGAGLWVWIAKIIEVAGRL